MKPTLRHCLRTALGVAGVAVAAHAAAQVTFFENEDFRGRQFNAAGTIGDFERYGFNDRASSAIVNNGRWEVCTDARFSGRCVVLRPGRYESLARVGLDNRASSVRAVARTAHNYNSQAAYLAGDDRYRRGKGERVFQAQVTSVHAVVGPPEQRCWVERQQVSERRCERAGCDRRRGHRRHSRPPDRRRPGQDIATAGGAVGGAALGANVGNSSYHDVQHCESTQRSSRPDYWDVTYNFRGSEHRVQMTSPPGPTIAVNGNGEPRV